MKSENRLKVLDLGCGVASPVYQALVELGKNFEYVGVDESKEVIEQNGKSKNAKFLQARIPYEMDIGKNYDLIVASYFFDADALNPSETVLTLLKAHEMLSSNGKFLILLPKEGKNIANFILRTFRRMGYRVKNLEDYKYRAKFSSDDSKAYETIYIIELKKSANYEVPAELKENLESAALLQRKEFEKLKNKDLKKAVNHCKLAVSGEPPFLIVNVEKINEGINKINELGKKLENVEREIERLEKEYSKVAKALNELKEVERELHAIRKVYYDLCRKHSKTPWKYWKELMEIEKRMDELTKKRLKLLGILPF